MARLTIKMKESIRINALVNAGVFAKKEKIVALRAELAEDVRVEGLGGLAQVQLIEDVFASMELLYNELDKFKVDYSKCCANSSNISYAAFSGRSVNLRFDGNLEFDTKTSIRRKTVPEERVYFAEDHPLTKEFDALLDLELAVKEEEEAINLLVMGTLNSVSTTGMLAEVWPESDSLLPAQERKIGLPAVQIDVLNKLVKLP